MHSRHYKNRARGVTVLKIGGVYVDKSYPDANEIAAAEEVYLGGHVYPVSDEIAAALTAAGYTVT